ncbi:MAG: putative membrane protein [Desulforhopalus sp.]|jgi:uncharacterized membrane protein
MIQDYSQIWLELQQAGVVTGKPPEGGTRESPWYVKTLLAFSGWLAALFFLGFIGMGLQFIFDNDFAAFTTGTVMISGAFFVLRRSGNEFIEHLALALSLAGQALVVYAIFNFVRSSDNTAFLLVALLQVVLALVMHNYIHCVFSAFLAAFSFSMFMLGVGWAFGVGAVLLLLVSWCFLSEFSYPQQMKKIRAIGYGLAIALIIFKGTTVFGSSPLRYVFHSSGSQLFHPWVGELLTLAVSLYVVVRILVRNGQSLLGRLALVVLAGTFILGLVSLEVQGITVGMVIMIVGFAGTNRLLLGAGIVSLLFYISSYYYLMESTLLEKSQTLLVVGIVLLLARWLMFSILGAAKGAGDE